MNAEEHQPDSHLQRRQDGVQSGDSSTWIPTDNAAHDNTSADAHLPHEPNNANGRPEHSQSAMGEQTIVRYSIDELLALRESKLVYAPDSFSAHAPLRPGVQVKMEPVRSVGGVRSQARNPYIGLEHIVGAQQRVPVQRGVGARGGFAEHSGTDRARAGYTDHADRVRAGFADHEGQRGGYSARGGQAPGGRNGRPQASGRHEGGMAAASWRTRTSTSDVAQPEWMDDGMTYDEGQSARQMQDMEEWKRRMREGADVVAPQLVDDQAAQRESRFLRLFTASEPQAQAPSVAETSRASEDDEQLSKLFKVFGSKVNVSSKSNADTTATSTAVNTVAPVSEARETGSPAPINEALRGIVPTSVFRKSAKGAARRPDSTSSSRSATPARNLPSWLVELSRGSPAQAPDLVDTLEREYPALGGQAVDAQSISSLSVQASGGAPSEANGSVGSGSSQPMGMSSQAVSQAILAQAAMAQAISQPMAQTISQPMGQGITPMNTQPMGMMGMPPPHMMMPGMNPALGQLPMPMGPPMGFHPNMMYGMPMPGMMGLPHMNDQLMLMKMMADPPMYGQMSGPPNMPHIAHS
ncbi:hypothetical protein J3F82_005649, partial [Coemansia sp. RSA 637]